MDQGKQQPKEVQVHLPIHCSFNKYLLSGAAGPGHSIITTIQLCLSGFSQLKSSALIILESASSTVLKNNPGSGQGGEMMPFTFAGGGIWQSRAGRVKYFTKIST